MDYWQDCGKGGSRDRTERGDDPERASYLRIEERGARGGRVESAPLARNGTPIAVVELSCAESMREQMVASRAATSLPKG
jgi:hypothetical protein